MPVKGIQKKTHDVGDAWFILKRCQVWKDVIDFMYWINC